MRQTAVVSLGSMMVAVLASCAAVPAPESRPYAEAGQGPCIQLSQVAGRRVVDASSVLFEMTGPANYVNRLQGQCPGLARLGTSATISIASGGEGGRLCRGDRIRVVDPVEVSGTGLRSYPTCVLSDFEPVPRATGP